MTTSAIQKFLQAVLPEKLANDMEAESRSWMVQCPNCKYKKSVWELGGIRWKAAGNPRKYLRCKNCGEKTWHQTYRKNV
jgi:hypothetical protein